MKVRRVDFYPDDWLVGTLHLSIEDRGGYITICSLIYSHGGPIPDDDRWLAAKSGLHRRTIRAAVSSLVRQGKVVSTTLDGRPSLMVNRCRAELDRALSRIAA